MLAWATRRCHRMRLGVIAVRIAAVVGHVPHAVVAEARDMIARNVTVVEVHAARLPDIAEGVIREVLRPLKVTKCD
jgi:hypothetical protein